MKTQECIKIWGVYKQKEQERTDLCPGLVNMKYIPIRPTTLHFREEYLYIPLLSSVFFHLGENCKKHCLDMCHLVCS